MGKKTLLGAQDYMVKFFPVLLTYNFGWNERNQYRLQSMAKFSLVLGIDLVPETLCISLSSWQLLSADTSQTVLCFQHTVHTSHLHFSGSCWYHPGCSHQHTPWRPRPERPPQKERGPCGSCFPWDQCMPITRDEKSCLSRPKCLCHLYTQWLVLLSVFSLLNTQKLLGSSLLILWEILAAEHGQFGLYSDRSTVCDARSFFLRKRKCFFFLPYKQYILILKCKYNKINWRRQF